MGELEKLWTKDLFDLFLSKAKNGSIGETGKLYVKEILKLFSEKMLLIADVEPALAKDIWMECKTKAEEGDGKGFWAGLEAEIGHALDQKFQKIGQAPKS